MISVAICFGVSGAVASAVGINVQARAASLAGRLAIWDVYPVETGAVNFVKGGGCI